MNSLPNSMTLGFGPYDGDDREQSANYDTEEMRKELAKIVKVLKDKKGFAGLALYLENGVYRFNFDYDVTKLDDEIKVRVITLTHNDNVCTDKIREDFEDDLSCAIFAHFDKKKNLSDDDIAEALDITKADIDKMYYEKNIYLNDSLVHVEFKMKLEGDVLWTIDDSFHCSIDNFELKGQKRLDVIAAIDCKLDETFVNLYY